MSKEGLVEDMCPLLEPEYKSPDSAVFVYLASLDALPHGYADGFRKKLCTQCLENCQRVQSMPELLVLLSVTVHYSSHVLCKSKSPFTNLFKGL